MKEELRSAVDFLTKILRTRNVHEDKVEKFNTTLLVTLTKHYEDHWFPEKPFKGSAYRCLRIYKKMDEMIQKAGAECGLSTADLFEYLPNELTIWVDPHEVSYRIGEDGSVGTLYENKEAKEALKESAKAAKAKREKQKQQQLQQQLNNILQKTQQEKQKQQQQQALLSQSSTGDSPHSSPSSSWSPSPPPPPGFGNKRSSPVPFMGGSPPHHHQQHPAQRISPVNFFHHHQQQQQQYHHHPAQRRSPPHHMGMRTSPLSHQYPFHAAHQQQQQQQQYPGAYQHHPQQQWAAHHHSQQQQLRNSPVSFMQRKTPSPIMTADDYNLHKQQQQLEQDLQQSNDFLQQCKDQLRYYFPESAGSSASTEPMGLDYLASTFVAS